MACYGELYGGFKRSSPDLRVSENAVSKVSQTVRLNSSKLGGFEHVARLVALPAPPKACAADDLTKSDTWLGRRKRGQELIKIKKLANSSFALLAQGFYAKIESLGLGSTWRLGSIKSLNNCISRSAAA